MMRSLALFALLLAGMSSEGIAQTSGQVCTVRRVYPTDGESSAQFGRAVATRGNWMFVGEPYKDVSGVSNAGRAHVYKYSNQGGWVHKGVLDGSNQVGGLRIEGKFGSSIAVDGNWLVIGEPYKAPTASLLGQVFMFNLDTSTQVWNQDSIATASSCSASWGQHGARFAYFDGLSLKSGSMMVGAPFWGPFTNTGECYALDYDTGTNQWCPQFQMSLAIPVPANRPDPNEQFPSSVSMFGSDTVAISSRRRPDPIAAKGTVWVMRRIGASGSWYVEIQIDNPSAAPGDQNFGRSIALGDDLLVVGASGWDLGGVANTGAVFVYKYDDGTMQWNLDSTFIGPDTVAGDAFGRSVAISGHNLLIGAAGADTATKTDVGACYLYHLNGGVFDFQRKIQPGSLQDGDLLGYPVAIGGKHAIMGAYSATGAAPGSGVVYTLDYSNCLF